MVNKPTVFVVDDDPGALQSLCWLIQQADLPVRAYRSGREFLDSYNAHDEGCIVLDIRMSGMDGLEVQKCLCERGCAMPVIFLTAHGDVPTCTQAFKGGAFDFLEKPVDDEILLAHIHKALARDAERKRRGSSTEFTAHINQLTPTERHVLDLLIAGKSLKEIARARNVTVQTVWRHRASVLQKLGVTNDVELVRLAMQWSYKGGTIASNNH